MIRTFRFCRAPTARLIRRLNLQGRVGLAALESAAVTPDELYHCVPAIEVGNVTFHIGKRPTAAISTLCRR